MLLLAQAAAATNAWAASRLLAASNARVTVKSAPGVIAAEDMARVRAVEAWLEKGAPPPQHWAVKSKEDVSIGKELARGRSKCVRHGRLGREKIVVVSVLPVSNSSNFAGTDEAGQRRQHLVEEMYFFEALRGRPGIPTLRGAFLDDGDLSIVVDDCGARITGLDHKKQPIASDAWRGFAKRDPLGAATALLEVFRSVVDYGGYLIKDFTPHQFTLHGNKLYLVDGPDVALDGPMATFLRGRPGFALCGNQPVDGARRRVAACSNALPSFPMQKACRATCPAMRTRFSSGPACCCPYPGTCASTAARELFPARKSERRRFTPSTRRCPRNCGSSVAWRVTKVSAAVLWITLTHWLISTQALPSRPDALPLDPEPAARDRRGDGVVGPPPYPG